MLRRLAVWTKMRGWNSQSCPVSYTHLVGLSVPAVAYGNVFRGGRGSSGPQRIVAIDVARAGADENIFGVGGRAAGGPEIVSFPAIVAIALQAR